MIGRPTIADDVVACEEERMKSGIKTEKPRANDRPIDEVEGCGSFFLLGVFQGRCVFGWRSGGQIVETHRKLALRRKVKRISLGNNRCPQGFMAIDEILHGGAHGLRVELPTHEQSKGLVKGA